jgi:UDP-N-acetylmuramoyl-L-alanyl-D-glutamate--2,6-diaminopimelate ligase
MPLYALLEPLLLKKVEGKVEEGEVTGLAYHSARVEKGNLFFALDGRRACGWEYAREALNRGALAAVVEKEAPLKGLPLIRVPDARLAMALLAEKFYGQPSRRLRLVGVTGTNGKTTTTHLVEALYRRFGEKTGLIGTIGYRINDETMPAQATTPEASDLQEILARMADRGVTRVAMEVSSHALAQHRVAGCRFAVAVLTNITSEHLDYHRTMEAYLEAKTKLFMAMGGASGDGFGLRAAVLNADDAHYAAVNRCCPGQKITYGVAAPADIRAEDIRFDSRGVSFRVTGEFGAAPFTLRIPGLFSVYNALAAVGVGLAEGYPLDEISAALAGVSGVPGRFELVNGGQDFQVVVDYAHTPDGLENVLRAGRQITSGRVITVFGCGGERDRSKRAPMGETAMRYSDLAIATNDNPRGEDPDVIFREIMPGLQRWSHKGEYRVIPDRREAIAAALQAARKGDLVMIAGKGHEEYQVLKDRVIPFSDRQVARELLEILAQGRVKADVHDWP